jgi:hypothetical protein
MIMQKMTIDEEKTGFLFDVCCSIWKNMKAAQTLRYNAFKMLVKITKKYPQFMLDVNYLLEPQFTENLLRGVKHSLSIFLKRDLLII